MTTPPDRFSRLLSGPVSWVDLTLAALALTLFAIAWPVFGETHSAPALLWPVLTAAGTWPLAAARRYPLAAWGVAFAAAAVTPFLRWNEEFILAWPVPQFLALVATALVAVWTVRWTHAWWIAAACVGLMLFNPTRDSRAGWMAGLAIGFAFVLLARRLVGSRRELADQSALTAQHLGARTLAEEKAGLARDLHDVVAHQMSMIVVQAQSAPYRLQGVTPAVHAEFDSLAETAREALDEVRGLLGVLRADGADLDTAPIGSAQLVPTLHSARAAGVDVAWTLDGDLDRLDETTGIVLHRVLQESLSNAARHAAGGAVQVTIRVGVPADHTDEGRHVAVLEVTNGPRAADALPVPVPETTGGSGVAGMAARVGAVGGTFTALPEADGAFTIEARVPLGIGR